MLAPKEALDVAVCPEVRLTAKGDRESCPQPGDHGLSGSEQVSCVDDPR